MRSGTRVSGRNNTARNVFGPTGCDCLVKTGASASLFCFFSGGLFDYGPISPSPTAPPGGRPAPPRGTKAPCGPGGTEQWLFVWAHCNNKKRKRNYGFVRTAPHWDMNIKKEERSQGSKRNLSAPRLEKGLLGIHSVLEVL